MEWVNIKSRILSAQSRLTLQESNTCLLLFGQDTGIRVLQELSRGTCLACMSCHCLCSYDLGISATMRLCCHCMRCFGWRIVVNFGLLYQVIADFESFDSNHLTQRQNHEFLHWSSFGCGFLQHRSARNRWINWLLPLTSSQDRYLWRT